jgi:hypothetical protein
VRRCTRAPPASVGSRYEPVPARLAAFQDHWHLLVPGRGAPSPVISYGRYRRALACTFHGHAYGEYPDGLSFDLHLLILVFGFAWPGAVLWSCFLTSAPGCGGEVRKRLAERVGRHPVRPAAQAAVSDAAQWPRV